jgi:hypothetical protein
MEVWTEEEKKAVKIGSVVQLSMHCGNKMFKGCFMTVTDPRHWGVQGYIQMVGQGDEVGGRAYYNANWEEISYAGHAVWMASSSNND